MGAKLGTALALLLAIMVLAGCARPSVEAARTARPSVEAARAAMPRIPATHEPSRPPHILRWEPYEPPVEWPPEGTAAFEARKQQRVNELEWRYGQFFALIPYACKAKDIWELMQATSLVDAANQFISNFGVNPTLVLRMVQMAKDMEKQSSIDQIGSAAVFALCDVY